MAWRYSDETDILQKMNFCFFGVFCFVLKKIKFISKSTNEMINGDRLDYILDGFALTLFEWVSHTVCGKIRK